MSQSPSDLRLASTVLLVRETKSRDADSPIEVFMARRHGENAFVADAYKKGWEEVAAEQAQKSPEFKKGWDSLNQFRAEYAIWRDRGYLR